MPEANEVVGKSSAFPRELRERFHARLRVAHVLAAVALAGASLASESAKAQAFPFPPINVPGTVPGGSGSPFGGGGWGSGDPTGCGAICDGSPDPFDGGDGRLLNADFPAPVTSNCNMEHELRLTAAVSAAQSAFTVRGTRIDPLVWSAREGDYFVTVNPQGQMETWEFLCGGRFCAGTVLKPSPVATACPN